MGELERFKAALESECDFAIPPKTAIERGVCCACGKPALERCYSDAGRREFRISGMCEVCFDECTKEPDMLGASLADIERAYQVEQSIEDAKHEPPA